jgi:hypothetical protein
MQLSVPRYQAISVNRGANLDLDAIDKPLTRAADRSNSFVEIRKLGSEADRLNQIAKLTR